VSDCVVGLTWLP